MGNNLRHLSSRLKWDAAISDLLLISHFGNLLRHLLGDVDHLITPFIDDHVSIGRDGDTLRHRFLAILRDDLIAHDRRLLRDHASFDDLLLHHLLLNNWLLHEGLLINLLLDYRLLHSAIALTCWSLAMTVCAT